LAQEITLDALTALFTSPILLTLLVTFGYVVTCGVWPFKRCRRCHGTGRHQAPIIRAYRPCDACKGTGMRLRIGRRAWNAWTRVNRARRADRNR
jgi:hypothetical protein